MTRKQLRTYKKFWMRKKRECMPRNPSWQRLVRLPGHPEILRVRIGNNWRIVCNEYLHNDSRRIVVHSQRRGAR